MRSGKNSLLCIQFLLLHSCLLLQSCSCSTFALRFTFAVMSTFAVMFTFAVDDLLVQSFFSCTTFYKINFPEWSCIMCFVVGICNLYQVYKCNSNDQFH